MNEENNRQPYEYQDPYQNRPPEEPAGFAIASLVLGIISLVISCLGINIITGILALIFGIIHMVKYNTRRGMAIAGIVLGAISIVIFIALVAIGIAAISSDATFMHEYNNLMDQL